MQETHWPEDKDLNITMNTNPHIDDIILSIEIIAVKGDFGLFSEKIATMRTSRQKKKSPNKSTG